MTNVTVGNLSRTQVLPQLDRYSSMTTSERTIMAKTYKTLAGHTVCDSQCPLCGAKAGWPCREPGGKFLGRVHSIRQEVKPDASGVETVFGLEEISA